MDDVLAGIVQVKSGLDVVNLGNKALRPGNDHLRWVQNGFSNLVSDSRVAGESQIYCQGTGHLRFEGQVKGLRGDGDNANRASVNLHLNIHRMRP